VILVGRRSTPKIRAAELCVHDTRNRPEIPIEKCNQVTCSFYGKAAILLDKHFSDRDLGPISSIGDTRLKDQKETREIILKTGHPVYDAYACVHIYGCEQNRAVRNRAERSGIEGETEHTAAEKRELTEAGAQHVYWRISQS